jgi:hypothetical protein
MRNAHPNSVVLAHPQMASSWTTPKGALAHPSGLAAHPAPYSPERERAEIEVRCVPRNPLCDRLADRG